MCLLGTFSEYTVVPTAAVAKVDESVALDKAALVGCGVTTGSGSMINTGEATAGSTVVVMGVGAWLGYRTRLSRPPPLADSGSAQSEGGAPLDAGPCNANDEARTCDGCFMTASALQCTVGGGPPDAGVLTMPLCRGGK